MEKKYKDCYSIYENGVLKLGNEFIQRHINFKNGYPFTEQIQNMKSGYEWSKAKGELFASFNIPVLKFDRCIISADISLENNSGCSNEFLQTQIKFVDKSYMVKWIFIVAPKLPFISTQLFIKGKGVDPATKLNTTANNKKSTGIESNDVCVSANKDFRLPVADSIEAFCIDKKHLKLESFRFYDVTDNNDELVKYDIEQLYDRYTRTAEGNIHIINSYLEDEAIILIKEGMTSNSALNREQDELVVNANSFIQLTGSGLDYNNLEGDEYTPCYGSTVGVGRKDEVKRQYKKYYKYLCKGDPDKKLFMMSNTWGDRNQDKAVCEEFMLKEIDTAAKLGIDIVQIDDGWQLGVSGNSAIDRAGVWEKFYEFNPDFWRVNNKKFPDGLLKLTQYAKDKGTEIGLWFVPDSYNDFSNWQKDTQVLLGFFREYGIRYFKLDGINIRNKKGESNLIKMMEKLTKESGNQIRFNLDITAQVRFGYFYEKHFGTLFVENRYTDWGNYYPHKTLKNIWQLSEFFPARKFQFEVLNNRRNIDKYMDDPLAPSLYAIDYIFAVTMLSNPLIWMEMSSLVDEDIKTLAGIIEVYKNERKEIFDSEVLPIGDKPDGTTFTGFQIITDKTKGYLLLFRENSKDDEYTYIINDIADVCLNIDKLYTNVSECDIRIFDKISKKGELRVKMDQKRSFIFAKYSI